MSCIVAVLVVVESVDVRVLVAVSDVLVMLFEVVVASCACAQSELMGFVLHMGIPEF